MEFLKKKKNAGYTFAEVITAFGIFSLFLMASATVGVNFYNAQQKERARNLVLEETQFLLNRIANLIRENTIDYAEYYSNGCSNLSLPDSPNYCSSWEDPIIYGDDMGEAFRQSHPGEAGSVLAAEYDRRFFYIPSCEPGEIHGEGDADGISCDYNDPSNYDEGYFNTGADDQLGLPVAPDYGNDFPIAHALMRPEDALNSNILDVHSDGYEQFELYLISPDGERKTILRRIGNGIDDDNDGFPDEDMGDFSVADPDGNERLGIGEMIFEDTNSDTFRDSYVPDSDFDLDGNATLELSDFISISPSNIEISELTFFIAPLEDPRKAFGENGLDVQIQPHVTILIRTRPSEKLSQRLPGDIFEVSVQTTVSSRVLDEVTIPSS